ncbi:MAG TPA: HD domain-containing phosphohydrolase [Bryobacterales bacterium]|jgi:diguanylate cyclase (GGDEF)-like protein/putative nucleotidyltransferase with HDIG domain|nr:HD domain-containing phosphohydrolase [Bryobacterales bacterium]
MKGRLSNYTLVLSMLAVLVGVGIIREWWTVAMMALLIFAVTLHSSHLHAAKLSAERRHAREVAELHLRTIEALAVAIDAKDNTTHQHLERVVIYAEAIGKELNLPEDDMKALRAAALLHDIGKLAVPEYIISKPGKLTEEEFEKMKIHTVVGAEILERVQFPYPVVPIVRSHHERWDGSGYPAGLRGEQIPIGARILAVVDSFDALSSDRQYRRALSRWDAMEAVKKEAGILYDPKIVDVLEKLYPKLEPLIESIARVDVKSAAQEKIVKGQAPAPKLESERTADTSSALHSIVQAREELQVLYQLTQALGTSLSVDETLRLIAEELRKLIPFDSIAVFLIREGKLLPRFVEGVNASLLARMQIPLGEGLSGWVAANGKYSLNGNPAVEPAYLQDPHQFSRLRCALSVPLDSPKGVIGAVTLYSTEHNAAFSLDHLRILKAVGSKAGTTLHNALIHEAMGRSAETDGLTGLPNARALSTRLEQESARATRQQTPYTLFVVDMNGLKKINDTFGHLMGNKIIKAVGNALRSSVREYDLVARMGGDEFVLLLPGMDASAAAAKRIELAMAVENLRKDFPNIEVSVSMGSASFPDDSRDSEKLMALADRRMYWHKREYHSTRAAITSA